MSIPDVPSVFRQSTPADRPWWWKFVDAAGAEVALGEDYPETRFSNQGDAESWVGEIWQELAEKGVAAVELYEDERLVYGPMSLSA